MSDLIEKLESECWSLICESYSNGDDSSIGWVVVGYYMGKPWERVLGYSDESGGPKAAIEMAIETTKDDSYNYLYEYGK